MKTHPALRLADARKAAARFGRAPRTTAVPLLPVDAPEDVWLAARRAGPDGFRVGASELAAVVGVSPYASPFSLWWSKQDEWESAAATSRQRYGHAVEEGTAKLFNEDHPELLVVKSAAGLWGHPVETWLCATPDFIGVGATEDGQLYIEPIEIKADRGRGWGRPGTADVPEHFRIQLLAQCEVLGASRGWLVHEDKSYVVPYDDAAQAEMAGWLAAGRAFVASLEAGVSPDLDDHEATTAALIQLHPSVDEGTEEVLPADLAEEFERALDDLAAAEARAREVKNRVRDRLGRAQYALHPDGRRLAQRLVYKRAAYQVSAGMVDQLRRTT